MISLDIETIPNPDALAILTKIAPIRPDPRLKDQQKIADSIASKQAALLDKLALFPETGKICCIGIASEKETVALCGNEKEILNGFIKMDVLRTDHLICTFNGKTFDIPWLYKRLLINNIDVPATWHRFGTMTKRYATQPHMDVKEVITSTQTSEVKGLHTLAFWAETVLGKSKIDADFTKFPEQMKTEEGRKAIEEYCLNDAVLCLELANKFKGIV